VVYYEDGSLSAVSWAYEWYVKNWYGVKPGAKEIRMMSLSTEYRPEAKALRMRQLLWRQVVLPGINLSERNYEATLAVLLRFRPAVLWGFTSAITGLAEYVNGRDKDLGSYRPKLVMTWAEPVYAHEEEALHQAFNCPVTNLYSSHEVGHIACRCPQGSFHINQENVLAECLRPLGNAQGQEEGEILITTLFETPMPFIRYRIGDVARIGPSTCACGMKSQVMSSFLGRTYELFVTADGRMISPNFWLHIMRRDYVAGFVKKFQIVYLKDGGIRVLVVRKESSSMDTESKLRALIAGNFDPQARIEWVYLPTITPEASGKCPLVKRER
jgi:phenylacetate-CoA ligase